MDRSSTPSAALTSWSRPEGHAHHICAMKEREMTGPGEQSFRGEQAVCGGIRTLTSESSCRQDVGRWTYESCVLTLLLRYKRAKVLNYGFIPSSLRTSSPSNVAQLRFGPCRNSTVEYVGNPGLQRLAGCWSSRPQQTLSRRAATGRFLF